MLRIFMIEWFDRELGKYNQEYYKSLYSVAERVKHLETVCEITDIEVTTVTVED